jgi:hypothetical protein
VLRAVADQPTFWERFSPKELRRLSMELARVDALLDDPVFSPRSGGSLTPAGGSPSSHQPQPRRIRHHQAHQGRPRCGWSSRPTSQLGLKGQLVGPEPNGLNPMARVMARPRRAVTQKHGGIAKGLLTRAFTWSG